MEVPGDDYLSSFLAKVPRVKGKVDKVTSYSDKSSQSESLGLTTKPSSDTGKALKPEANTPVSYLVPDWRKKRELYSLKERTLTRIYFSKWFYQGLEWQERELLLLLLESQKISGKLIHEVIFEEDMALNNSDPKKEMMDRVLRLTSKKSLKSQPIKAICFIGASVLSRLEQQRETSLNLRGTVRWENEELLELLYSEKDYNAVWKLRTFQSLRDKLFAKFVKAKQNGKAGIKKPRIRGYTDGRGSSGDTRRTKMARELDAWFWSDQSENSWTAMFEEMERLSLT